MTALETLAREGLFLEVTLELRAEGDRSGF
jgi:hypothetical protein